MIKIDVVLQLRDFRSIKKYAFHFNINILVGIWVQGHMRGNSGHPPPLKLSLLLVISPSLFTKCTSWLSLHATDHNEMHNQWTINNSPKYTTQNKNSHYFSNQVQMSHYLPLWHSHGWVEFFFEYMNLVFPLIFSSIFLAIKWVKTLMIQDSKHFTFHDKQQHFRKFPWQYTYSVGW